MTNYKKKTQKDKKQLNFKQKIIINNNNCAIINLNGNYEGHFTPTATGIYIPSIDIINK